MNYSNLLVPSRFREHPMHLRVVPGIGARMTNLCAGTPKAQLVPAMIANFAAAFSDSLQQPEALRWFLSRLPTGGAATPSAFFAAFRTFTVYRDEPACVDGAYTLAESLKSQLERGYFGDCAAYAIALAALMQRATGNSGYWLLVGDKKDPAKHILNAFARRAGRAFEPNPDSDALLIDCTNANGDGWPLPPNCETASLIRPATGEVIHTWSR